MDIIETIDGHALRHPDKLAHIWRENTLTYAQLSQWSDRLANYITQKFCGDRSPVIVYGHKQNEMLVSFLGCVKAGHAYIPISSSLPTDRISAIVESSKSKLMICIDDISSDLIDNEVLDCKALSDIFNCGCELPPDKSHRVKEDDVYYIIYTSGSTGKPKGVQITLQNLHSFIKWAHTLGNLPSRKDHVFLNTAPFSFDLSVMDLYLSLYTGSTLFSTDEKMIADIRGLFAFLNKSNATVCVCTPSFADMCLADRSFHNGLLPSLQCFLFCGETLMNKTAEELQIRFPNAQVVNLYGPTEATVSVTAVTIDHDVCTHISPLPVGISKSDCEILIMDSVGQPVQEGEHGEIVIAGDSVSIGYYGNTEMTNKCFFNWHGRRAYRTGDEGYLKGPMLYYCGRLDFQIKLNGYRIEIEDIENNIRRLDGVANATVVPSVVGGKITHLVAFVIPCDMDIDRTLKGTIAFKQKLKAFLPEYMIPRKIVFMDRFPTNTNGKIDRKALAREVK